MMPTCSATGAASPNVSDPSATLRIQCEIDGRLFDLQFGAAALLVLVFGLAELLPFGFTTQLMIVGTAAAFALPVLAAAAGLALALPLALGLRIRPVIPGSARRAALRAGVFLCVVSLAVAYLSSDWPGRVAGAALFGVALWSTILVYRRRGVPLTGEVRSRGWMLGAALLAFVLFDAAVEVGPVVVTRSKGDPGLLVLALVLLAAGPAASAWLQRRGRRKAGRHGAGGA